MSILSEAAEGKISFSEGVEKAEAWFGSLIAHSSPTVQADAAAGLDAFKQTLSNVVGIVDTALAPIISTGALAVEAATSTALTAAFGAGVAGQLTPGLDAGITQATNALKAEVDAVAAQLRAKIVGTPPAA